MNRRSILIYSLLAAVWALLMGWLTAEHFRVVRSARAALVNRMKDISSTCGIVVRSQRRFGVISKERLESALNELVKPGELQAIALLNAAGDIVASAGDATNMQFRAVVRGEPTWEPKTVTMANLVDLGTNVTGGVERTNPPIILPRQDYMRPFETNRPPGPPPEPRPPPGTPTNGWATNAFLGTNFPGGTNPAGGRWDWRRGSSDGRPRMARPFWMSEEEYKTVSQKQGVHSFVVVMSTAPVRAIASYDFWLRSMIALLATITVLGSAVAYRNFTRTSDLQLRLVRASEMNTHLKQMNLAAAGLAHETRNPLNIIRGLAQLISKQEDASPETREKSREIIDEADRVTAQLNEFINYSRPREVRRAPVPLATVVGEVVRTLGFDVEEKNIRLHTPETPLTIEADEQLLRQALFNLLLNAIQAVDKGGEIRIAVQRLNGAGAVIEVRDDGPGVPSERRAEIFKPYFTTNEKGTGLGLAVVQQIVLAHGWEIQCLPNEPRGALFRISHVKLAAPA